MTKKEMQAKLIDEYGYKKSEVDGKANAVLEEMLKDAEEKAKGGQKEEGDLNKEPKEDGETEVVEKETGTQKEKEETMNKEVLRTVLVSLESVKESVYVVRNKGSVVEIYNKGYGDVYITGGEEQPVIGDTSQLLLTREKKVIEGMGAIKMISSSNPMVEITEVK